MSHHAARLLALSAVWPELGPSRCGRVDAWFFAIRELRLRTVIDDLRLAQQGLPINKKVVTSRYSKGLPRVSEDALTQVVEALQR